jgi:hypothetical protein
MKTSSQALGKILAPCALLESSRRSQCEVRRLSALLLFRAIISPRRKSFQMLQNACVKMWLYFSGTVAPALLRCEQTPQTSNPRRRVASPRDFPPSSWKALGHGEPEARRGLHPCAAVFCQTAGMFFAAFPRKCSLHAGISFC